MGRLKYPATWDASDVGDLTPDAEPEIPGMIFAKLSRNSLSESPVLASC
jgi:hypothetical protein